MSVSFMCQPLAGHTVAVRASKPAGGSRAASACCASGSCIHQAVRPASAAAYRVQCKNKNRRSSHVLRAIDPEVDNCEGSDYVAVGLAHCYEEVGKGNYQDVYVIEPVTAGSLESMVNGAKTTFEEVAGVNLEEALSLPSNNVLPASFQKARLCEDFEFRTKCATRTWNRPHAQENLLELVPQGTSRGDWNMDTTDKRILNFENVVDDSDNIKQDMSIDVYGRKEDEKDEIADAYNA